MNKKIGPTQLIESIKKFCAEEYEGNSFLRANCLYDVAISLRGLNPPASKADLLGLFEECIKGYLEVIRKFNLVDPRHNAKSNTCMQ